MFVITVAHAHTPKAFKPSTCITCFGFLNRRPKVRLLPGHLRFNNFLISSMNPALRVVVRGCTWRRQFTAPGGQTSEIPPNSRSASRDGEAHSHPLAR